ncbi:MAG: nucleotide exchange factor GrpE [Anaerolineae bacterium]|nr:nucleotide exchange factor GrpE [Anaerolineae bacterium]
MKPEVTEGLPPVTDGDDERLNVSMPGLAGVAGEARHDESRTVEQPGEQEEKPPVTQPPVQEEAETQESLEVWRERALRLQAEMENFRKRQQRLAEERIASEREKLLRSFLEIADNLERALNTDGADVQAIREGVRLTYQAMQHLMTREGAEPIQPVGEPFDPTWHEAVASIPHTQAQVAPDTVVEVVQTGYRIGERLLRPARVVVAV